MPVFISIIPQGARILETARSLESARIFFNTYIFIFSTIFDKIQQTIFETFKTKTSKKWLKFN
jgi:hypothetical protein